MSDRHIKRLPQEMLFPFASLGGGATLTNRGGFAGVLIDADDEAAYITLFVPHDFTKFVSLRLVVIPIAANAAMTVRCVCNFAHNGLEFDSNAKTVDYEWLAVEDALQEIEVMDLLDTLSLPIDYNDYIGIQVIRNAGQNTNAIICGVKLRYR